MSIYILINPSNNENLVATRTVEDTTFCLEQQQVPFADQKFTIQSTSTNLNVSHLSSNTRYLLRWIETGQYLDNQHGTSCFSLTNDINLASIWEDRDGGNKTWYVTSKTKDNQGNITERTTVIQVSILPAKECTGCTVEEICNLYNGTCGTCASCSESCFGPCPDGFACELVNNMYQCIEQKDLTWLWVSLAIIGFLVVLVGIVYFATR